MAISKSLNTYGPQVHPMSVSQRNVIQRRILLQFSVIQTLNVDVGFRNITSMWLFKKKM